MILGGHGRTVLGPGVQVRFTVHAQRKLELLHPLGVTEEDVVKAVTNPDELLYDILRYSEE